MWRHFTTPALPCWVLDGRSLLWGPCTWPSAISADMLIYHPQPWIIVLLCLNLLCFCLHTGTGAHTHAHTHARTCTQDKKSPKIEVHFVLRQEQSGAVDVFSLTLTRLLLKSSASQVHKTWIDFFVSFWSEKPFSSSGPTFYFYFFLVQDKQNIFLWKELVKIYWIGLQFWDIWMN